MLGHERNRQRFTDDIGNSGSLADVQREQVHMKKVINKHSAELKSLGRMCGHIAEETFTFRSQFDVLVKEVHQLRGKEEYHRSWAHCQPQWMPTPRMPAPAPFRPPMYGRYPNPLAMSAYGYAPSSPPAPAGMAAPMGPFQPMYPSGSLQHSMAVPHQQAGLNEGFAGEACYYNYTEPEGTLQQQQQVEEYGGTPHNNFSMSQEVQGSASSYAWQYPAQHYWQPQDRAVPASKQTLRPAEHLAAPQASSRQTEAQQGEQMQDKLVDVDADAPGSGLPTIATANPQVRFHFLPKGFNIIVAARQPLQSPAVVPAAIKPETHSGVSPPGPILPASSTVLAATAAPAAMAEPGVQPAALQESCLPTTDVPQGHMPSHAQRHQLQRHASLCRDPEGTSSSSTAEADPPAHPEEAPVSGQHGPSAAPAEDVQPQLEGAPAPGTIATAAPEPQTALPAPEPAAKSSTYADTTQERELLPASRDAAPATSKPAGAVPASSIKKSATVLPEGRTWAVVAAQLPFKPAILPLQRSRQASQGGSPGVGGQPRALRPSSVPQQSNKKYTQGRSQGPSSQQQALGQRTSVRQPNDNKKQGPRKGNGARGKPKTAQHEGNNQKGPGKGRVLEVLRPSTQQTGNGASQARQSSRKRDTTQHERGGSAVLVVARTPDGQLKPETQC